MSRPEQAASAKRTLAETARRFQSASEGESSTEPLPAVIKGILDEHSPRQVKAGEDDKKIAVTLDEIEEKLYNDLEDDDSDDDSEFTAVAEFLDEKKSELRNREAEFVHLGLAVGTLLTLAHIKSAEFGSLANAAIIQKLQEMGISPEVIGEINKFLPSTSKDRESILQTISKILEGDNSSKLTQIISEIFDEKALQHLSNIDSAEEEIASALYARDIMMLVKEFDPDLILGIKNQLKIASQDLTDFSQTLESSKTMLGLRMGVAITLVATKGSEFSDALDDKIVKTLIGSKLSQETCEKILQAIQYPQEKLLEQRGEEATPGAAPKDAETQQVFARFRRHSA